MGQKRKHSEVEAAQTTEPKKQKWMNKQRVLTLCTRGISFRDRHLLDDLRKMMPHHKTEPKLERAKTLSVINEMCEMKNCNKAILFEGRKKLDLYMWLANIPNGPSAKFYVENIYTIAELKLTGNCLRGSRPLLSFDPTFTQQPHYMLLKELLTQIFGVPKRHPKSQPFFDHVFTFTILDNRIWFRNYQILSEDGALAEIGPRFVLNPVKVFSGSFNGVALWENPTYVSPGAYRQQIRLKAKDKYVNRVQQKVHSEATRPTRDCYKLTDLDDVFEGDVLEKAEELANKENELKEKRKKGDQKILKKKTVKKSDIKEHRFEDEKVNILEKKVKIIKKISPNNSIKRIKEKGKKIKK